MASYLRETFNTLVQLPVSLINLGTGRTAQRSNNEVLDVAQDPAQISEPSQYRLENLISASLSLPDGRELGYAQCGLLTGKPVFYFHGTPGSRMEGVYFDAIAAKLGIRFITVDRPSYGWSSPHPNRTILDFVKDVERLANHLKLSNYGVLGISGGGPYALACAASMPADKLKAVSVVVGIGPPDMGYRGVRWLNYLGFILGYHYAPSLVRWYFRSEPAAQLHLDVEKRLSLLRQELTKAASSAHPKDATAWKDVDRLRAYIHCASENYRQGFDGVVQDGQLMTSPFGFRIEDIRSDLPVQLWYGKFDIFVPPHHGEETAMRLGSNARLRFLDETHASIVVNHDVQILEDLVKAM